MLSNKLKDHIDNRRSNMLVIGPPGTGKTYNLLETIQYLIEEKDVSPDRILVFCFNRKWSKIIREESALRMPGSFIELPVETFFSFSKDLIAFSEI